MIPSVAPQWRDYKFRTEEQKEKLRGTPTLTSLYFYPPRLHLNSNRPGVSLAYVGLVCGRGRRSRRGAHDNHSHASVCFGNKRYWNEIDGTGSSRADVSCINGKLGSVYGNTAQLFTARSFTVRRRSSPPPYTHARHTHA